MVASSFIAWLGKGIFLSGVLFRQHDFTAEALACGEAGVAAVGLGDLCDELEAGAVGGVAVCGNAAAGGGSACRGVAFNDEHAVFAAFAGSHMNRRTRWIVAHAVIEEIGEGAMQQNGVGVYGSHWCVGQINLKRIALSQAAIEKIRRSLAHDGLRLERFSAQGLHGAIEAHGEVEVAYQIANGLALGADNGGILAHLF